MDYSVSMHTRAIFIMLFAAFVGPGITCADDVRLNQGAMSRHVTDPTVVPNIIRNAVQPFSYADVDLQPGLLQQRSLLNTEYLLTLSNDSLLYLFRSAAGLPTPGKPYGGWCAVPELSGTPQWPHNGHFQGYYLSALARTYAASGDIRLKVQADEFIAGLAACQKPNGTLYCGAYMKDGDPTSPKMGYLLYDLDKWLKALDLARRCLGNDQAFQVRSGLVKWIERMAAALSDEQLQKWLDKEQGAISEALYDFYAETGEARHLTLAKRFEHRKFLDSLARGEDQLAGVHANTAMPKVCSAARAYELTGDDYYRRVVENFWNIVAQTRTYATGSSSTLEYWHKANELRGTLSATNQETCPTYYWMFLTKYLWRWTGDQKYADMYERCLYNSLIAAQNPITGMLAYYTPLKAGIREPDYTQEGAQGGSRKNFGTMFANFWCCQGSGAAGLARVSDNIYTYSKDRLYVNLFAASQVRWKHGSAKIRLTQVTDYPDADSVQMQMHLTAPAAFSLMIRIPLWAFQGGRIDVNGQAVDLDLARGSFVQLKRTWRDGDVVNVRLPMSLYSKPINDDPNCVAVMFGPHVMAGLTYDIWYPANDRENFFARQNLKLKGDPANPAEWLAPVLNQKMSFLTTASDQHMMFIPLYRVVAERYGVYFDVKK